MAPVVLRFGCAERTSLARWIRAVTVKVTLVMAASVSDQAPSRFTAADAI